MSIARHHAEWLSLVEVSGPFLSMPVLLRVLPQGLDAHDPEHLRLLRLAHDEWEEACGDPSVHRAWVRFVLTQTLEFPDDVLAEGQAAPQTLRCTVAEHGETLRPDLAVLQGDKSFLLIQVCPAGQDLDRPLAGHHWKASPATRMMELLHSTGVRLGLVTNGEHWMLVDAPRGETTGFASWYAGYWREEPLTLRAFRTLLSARRFFSVPEDETLAAMLAESASNQQEVTNQLGYQVRKAVEVLIQSLDRADQDHGRKLLGNLREAELYEAALTVMMRLVFLFSAEERGLLLLGDPLYDQFYAVSTLRQKLREEADQHGEEVLERRLDAWVRLLSTFRVVHGGVEHERLKLPAYGGHLFDPDRFPFLEGRQPGTSWRVESEGWRVEGEGWRESTHGQSHEATNQGEPHESAKLQGTGGLAVGDGPRRALLHGDKGVSAAEAVRPDEPDSESGRVHPGQHRRGTGQGTHQGVPQPPEHRPGIAHGVGNPPDPESAGGTAGTSKGRSVAGPDRPHQPDALRSAQGPGKTPLNPPPSTLHPSPTPLPVNNRTILHLLEALQVLQVKVPGGGPAEARRLSFRALDIEQIGHVYEGLLDHAARRATGPCLGLTGTKDREPEVALAELERRKAKGEKELLKFLKEETGRSESALKKALAAKGEDLEEGRFRTACGNNAALWERVRPFAGLVRMDTFGYPVVIPTGSVYVTEGTDRRSTGTHYTPRSLTEPIVQYTLEPLVYVGPAEGKPREEWRLRPARELLSLKVCDMATGSGAFLVQACRYLAERLLEAWEEAEQTSVMGKQEGLPFGGTQPRPKTVPRITPFGEVAAGRLDEQIIPDKLEDRQVYAMRLAAQRCLYGVDKNPLAVEMAKLSLWLLTLAKGQPFTFLDHAIRRGDSLVGISSLRQLETFSLDAKADIIPTLLKPIHNKIKIARMLREELEQMPSATIADIEAKQEKHQAAEQQLARLRYAADWLLAGEWEGLVGNRPGVDLRKQALIDALLSFADEPVETLRLEASTRLLQNGIQSRFHWPLEFPEAFLDRGGFDAIVGNPPFMGGQKITGNLGADYREYLVRWLAKEQRGSADLCAYFFLRARQLLREGGGFGLLATNTIAQGDTREVGLDQLTADGVVLPRAVPSRKWPGTASLEVAHVWGRRGSWAGPHVLDDRPVDGITAFLTPPSTVTGKPYRLKANEGKSFQGSIVLGMGFVLQPEEAQRLIDKDARNKDVLFPYLNGEDLNSRPDQSPSRWVINFFDWPLNRETAPDDYEGPVASDYPDCLRIVEEKVKPERSAKQNNATARDRAKRWWRYGRSASELYATIAGMERVLVLSLVNNHLGFGVVPTGTVFAHKLAVFACADWDFFAVLQSHLHYHWAWHYSSTMRTDINYSPSDCFETFPLPAARYELAVTGEQYHEYRRQVMMARHLGLTKTYNRFHDPKETAADIVELRRLHVATDQAVAAAYGWSDLDLGHGFHATRQGVRYTLREPARQEVLARLLTLNHQRYAEEVAKGLHEKKKPRNTRKTRKKKTDEGGGMFG